MRNVTGIPPLRTRWGSKAIQHFTTFKTIENHHMHTQITELGIERLKRTDSTSENLNRKMHEQIPKDVDKIEFTNELAPWIGITDNIEICTSAPQYPSSMTEKNDTSKEEISKLTQSIPEERYSKEA